MIRILIKSGVRQRAIETLKMVFYLVKKPNQDGSFNIELTKKYLPIDLKKSFLERFKNRPTITEEDLDDFLADKKNKLFMFK